MTNLTLKTLTIADLKAAYDWCKEMCILEKNNKHAMNAIALGIEIENRLKEIFK